MSGIGYFEGTFSLQVKGGSCPYEMPPRRVAYALQKPLKEELEDQVDFATIINIQQTN